MGNAQGVPPGGQPPMGGAGDSQPGSGPGAANYPPNIYGGPPADYTAASPSPFDTPQMQQQQQQQQQMPPNEKEGQRPSSSDMLIDGDSAQGGAEVNWQDDDTVPTVFRWEHGGRQVYITGTFNGWSRQIPMHRSGNDFTYIHNLKRGKHAFKFIVDDEWRFAPDQPTVADIEGRINNFIDVTGFKAYTGDREFEKEKAAAAYGAVPVDQETEGDSDVDAQGSSTKPDQDGEVFSHNMPDVDDYTKEPPPLPPHLRHIILNKPPQLQDTAALPVPQHVALNHLYCTAIKDNMMVLGITQRYKTKFVTTVYYSPCANK